MDFGVWVPVAIGVVGVAGTVAGALAWSHKAVVTVLVEQIEARTAESKEDRLEFAKIAGAVGANTSAVVELTGLIQEERKITARRHKETCAILEKLVPEVCCDERNHSPRSKTL